MREERKKGEFGAILDSISIGGKWEMGQHKP